MSLVPFTIKAEPIGARIEVDGEDVSAKVTSYSLVGSAREPTVLTLELKPGANGEISGVGRVEAVRPPGDLLEDLARLVEALDPREVESQALNDPDLLNEEHAVTAAALRAIARMIRAGA